MKASFTKRLGAYFIDILILLAVFALMAIILPENQNLMALNSEMSQIYEQALEGQLTFGKYFIRFTDVLKDIDQELVLYNIINSFFILIYFVILPYFQNGQTIGKKLFKIKIERQDNEKLMLNELLIRSFCIHGLIYMLVSLVNVFVLPPIAYFIVTSIFGFFQILLVIVSVFMIIYRKDKRGLQDIFSKTRVVDLKERV